MTETLQIRQATEADLPRLVRLAECTFRETFTIDNTPADMEAYVRKAFSSDQIAAELKEESSVILLAFCGSIASPVGYGKLQASPPDSNVQGPSPAEILRLYVAREAIGSGVGAKLLLALIEEARNRGYETVWLGVWEHNHRAISFYERFGFRRVGAHEFLLGADQQIDLILERPV